MTPKIPPKIQRLAQAGLEDRMPDPPPFCFECREVHPKWLTPKVCAGKGRNLCKVYYPCPKTFKAVYPPQTVPPAIQVAAKRAWFEHENPGIARMEDRLEESTRQVKEAARRVDVAMGQVETFELEYNMAERERLRLLPDAEAEILAELRQAASARFSEYESAVMIRDELAASLGRRQLEIGAAAIPPPRVEDLPDLPEMPAAGAPPQGATSGPPSAVPERSRTSQAVPGPSRVPRVRRGYVAAAVFGLPSEDEDEPDPPRFNSIPHFEDTPTPSPTTLKNLPTGNHPGHMQPSPTIPKNSPTKNRPSASVATTTIPKPKRKHGGARMVPSATKLRHGPSAKPPPAGRASASEIIAAMDELSKQLCEETPPKDRNSSNDRTRAIPGRDQTATGESSASQGSRAPIATPTGRFLRPFPLEPPVLPPTSTPAPLPVSSPTRTASLSPTKASSSLLPPSGPATPARVTSSQISLFQQTPSPASSSLPPSSQPTVSSVSSSQQSTSAFQPASPLEPATPARVTSSQISLLHPTPFPALSSLPPSSQPTVPSVSSSQQSTSAFQPASPLEPATPARVTLSQISLFHPTPSPASSSLPPSSQPTVSSVFSSQQSTSAFQPASPLMPGSPLTPLSASASLPSTPADISSTQAVASSPSTQPSRGAGLQVPAESVTLTPNLAMSTFLNNGSSVADAFDNDDWEDMYYPNANDLAELAASGRTQGANQGPPENVPVATGTVPTDSRPLLEPAPASDTPESAAAAAATSQAATRANHPSGPEAQGEGSREANTDGWRDALRDVLGLQVPDFLRSSSSSPVSHGSPQELTGDDHATRSSKRQASSDDADKDRPEKRQRNDEETVPGDTEDRPESEQTTAEAGRPGTSGNPFVINDSSDNEADADTNYEDTLDGDEPQQAQDMQPPVNNTRVVYVIYWSQFTQFGQINPVLPEVFRILTPVPFAVSWYELLLDSLDLGQNQRITVWNRRNTRWMDIVRTVTLPTDNDTLILLKKPRIRFCPEFEDRFVGLRGDASRLPDDVRDRAIDIIAE